MSDQKIRVVVAGACGRMGREISRAVSTASDMQLVGACGNVSFVGRSLAEVAGGGTTDVQVSNNLDALLAEAKPDVLVNVTTSSAVIDNVRTAIAHRTSIVVGTTGVSESRLRMEAQAAEEAGLGILLTPNFAIGAVLMMKFASKAAGYMAPVETVELHHDRKLDAPSGTSVMTAEMVARARDETLVTVDESPARGVPHKGTRTHSVRLQGLIAHQQVIFSGQGQVLTIRHDSLDLSSFIPGAFLAIRRVRQLRGLVCGLDQIL